jgi:plastocyanin
MTKRAWTVLIGALGVAITSCGGAASGASRTVLVDFSHDQFAGGFIGYFPNEVTLHPGDTVDFRQAWNGEPHTVTMGTMVDAAMTVYAAEVAKYGDGSIPPDEQQKIDAAFQGLPGSEPSPSSAVDQVAAQPCFIDSGAPPAGGATPCPKRAQPAFNGRQSYFSSGVIPYAGTSGNQVRVELADDIKPGTYHFYCNIHGPQMSGIIVVKPKGASIPSQSAVSRKAGAVLDKQAAPVLTAIKTASQQPFDIVRAARAAHFIGPDEQPPADIAGFNLAGYGYEGPDSFVYVSEFLPRRITTTVGSKVTWLMVGPHTVSFGVPRYFPLFSIDKDGTVKTDKRATDPVGGPGFPEHLPDNPPNPYVIDGGKWSGVGEHSSGLPIDTGSDQQLVGYSLTFTRAGTYNYACLIHPRMVGKVVVKEAP